MTMRSDPTNRADRASRRAYLRGGDAAARPAAWPIRARRGIVPGVLVVAGRRLWNHLALMLAIGAGYVLALALVISIPVYAEAVGYRVLRDELAHDDSAGTRSPFAFMYRYLGAMHGPIAWDAYAKLDRYMGESGAQQLGLPVQQIIRYAASSKLPLLPASGAGAPLLNVNLAFASDLEQHIDVVDGRLPQPGGAGPVEVLVAQKLAEQLGFQAGEDYLVLGPKSGQAGLSIPVRIAGVWRARDAGDPYWFYRISGFDETLFMPEASFTARVAARSPQPVYVALWYLLADGSGIRSADVPAVSARIARSSTAVSGVLPGARLEISPAEALGQHQAQVRRLTLILTVFSIPILGLIAYFILLVAELIVQRQSSEIAVLRSRGASRSQILALYLAEQAILGVAALGLGLLLGQAAALLMTWTRSFLELAPAEPLPIELTPEAWRRGAQMLALVVLASLLPALGAARHTVVSQKLGRARELSRPLWQRAYLDILLLIAAWYAYTQLSQRGTIAVFGGADGDPFANPLLLLAPTLYMLALALLAIRLFPLALRLCDRALGRLPGIAVATALRYLARAPRAYTGPLLLVTLTMSLAAFTASMARTLDGQLFDRVGYDIGGDLRLDDLGESTAPNTPAPAAGAAQPASDQLAQAKYLFLPVSEYLTVPGARAATRVLRSAGEVRAGGTSTPVQLLGIDRADFAQVAAWRDDYAPEPLGALMNRLADSPAAVLISADFAARRQLQIGDSFPLAVQALGEWRETQATVAGYVGLFPTTYAEDGPLVIANLDYLFEQVGTQLPYEVWLSVRPGASHAALTAGIQDLSLMTFERGYAPDAVAQERARPARQGLFGLLTIGFVASALLTTLGLLFYTAISLQRRSVELGVLRAIGLSTRQLGGLLACEQALIVGVGMLAGTLIGVSASGLFIPFLQVRAGPHPLTPPFLVRIAWDQIGAIYLGFGGLLALAVLLTLARLRRMRLFQAIKLGEAI
jgi:putative ABC transport system permease protein